MNTQIDESAKLISYRDLQKELKECQVTIDEDIVSMGLDYMLQSAAKLIGYMDRVCEMLKSARINKLQWENSVSDKQFTIDADTSRIMLEKAVQDMKSEALRKAEANNRLAVQLLALHQDEQGLAAAETHYKTVMDHYEQLKTKKEVLSSCVGMLQFGQNIGLWSVMDLKGKRKVAPTQ